jgi:hypothetical protein
MAFKLVSFRFSDMFPDVRIVQDVQDELDSIIENGVFNIVELLKNKDNDIRTHIKTNVEVIVHNELSY